MSERPSNYSGFSHLLGELLELIKVILMGKSDYSDTERYNAESAKGKGTQDKAWRKPYTNFQESSASGVSASASFLQE